MYDSASNLANNNPFPFSTRHFNDALQHSAVRDLGRFLLITTVLRTYELCTNRCMLDCCYQQEAIHFNIISHLHLRLHRSLSFWILRHNSVCTPVASHASYVSCPPQTPSSCRFNYMGRRTEFMKLISVQPSPASCYS